MIDRREHHRLFLTVVGALLFVVVVLGVVVAASAVRKVSNDRHCAQVWGADSVWAEGDRCLVGRHTEGLR